jgi:predicted PurR-regulated permease PerM
VPAGRPVYLWRNALSSKDALRVVYKTLLVVGTLVALYLLFALRRLVLTLFVAIILASALRPVVGLVERRLRLARSAAALLLYGLVAVAVYGGTAVLVPSILSDAMTLLERAPEIYARWYEMAISLRADTQARLGLALPLPPPQAQIEGWVAGMAAQFQVLLPQYALKTLGVLADTGLGLVMAYYWLEARDQLVASGPQALPPSQRDRFLAIYDDIEHVLGGYLGGQLLLSLLIAVVTLVLFVAIGLPNPAVLAFIGGVLHIIPLVGAAIGVVPAILVALSLSPATALLTAAALLIVHQVENSLIAPRVLERRVGLNPLLVIVALAAGAMLDGAVGALIALPAVGTAWILARDLLLEPAASRHHAAQDGEQLAAAQTDDAPLEPGPEGG